MKNQSQTPRPRRWGLSLLCVVMLALALWSGLNIAVDPFGTFGDRLLRWDSYNLTYNPRNAKSAYLVTHLDDYDGYIIGSSSASAYLPETLNEYLGGSFYNAFHYGSDLAYDQQLVSYLLENDDDVKNIFLVLGLSDGNAHHYDTSLLAYRCHWRVSGENPIAYYAAYLFAHPNYAFEKLRARKADTILPQIFDVFVAESGVYDKRVRDVEPIGSLSDYLAAHGDDFAAPTSEPQPLSAIDGCVQAVENIRALCDKAGVCLTVVFTPAYESQIARYTTDSINALFTALARVTDYWNFACSPLSFDPRYFYDYAHTRNAAANMVLAYMYGDGEHAVYDDLGVYCVRESTVSINPDAAPDTNHTAALPILLYHHLSETEAESAVVLHPDTFEHQMALLKETGWQTVTFDDAIAFVEAGTPLPERAFLLTFDDGYESNYDLALPILEKYGFDATIFVIGSSVGHDTYQDTSYAITPHFGAEEIADMTASGRVAIASHTWNMHQWAPFESGGLIRESILPLDGESESDYIAALRLDIELQNWLFSSLGLGESRVLAYPMGRWTTLTNVVLRESGYKATVTVDPDRTNTLVAGLPQSLYCLGRLTVSGDTGDEALLAYLSRSE